jgi:predicted nucleic acid-binding protein
LIVLDSSAAVDYFARGDAFEWVEARILESSSVHAPHLVDVEFVGVLRRLVAGGEVAAERAEAALADLSLFGIRRYAHSIFLARIWELRQNLTAPDAAYVALAEALDAPLVTTDLRLRRVPGLRIDVQTP